MAHGLSSGASRRVDVPIVLAAPGAEETGQTEYANPAPVGIVVVIGHRLFHSGVRSPLRGGYPRSGCASERHERGQCRAAEDPAEFRLSHTDTPVRTVSLG